MVAPCELRRRKYSKYVIFMCLQFTCWFRRCKCVYVSYLHYLSFLAFPICFFSFFLFSSYLLFYLFFYLLPSRIWTRSVSRPEVVGGDRTWVLFILCYLYCLVKLVKIFYVHVRYMLSPVRLSSVCHLCLSSVTFMRPTQAVQIFGNISTALGTLAIRCHPLKISWRSSQGNPSAGELNTRGVSKYSDFGPIDSYISETLQDRMYVSINH